MLMIWTTEATVTTLQHEGQRPDGRKACVHSRVMLKRVHVLVAREGSAASASAPFHNPISMHTRACWKHNSHDCVRTRGTHLAVAVAGF